MARIHKKIIILTMALFTCGCVCNEAKMLLNTPQVVMELTRLKKERKFDEDIELLYAGAPSEKIRRQASASIDTVIETLLEAGSGGTEEHKFWNLLKVTAGEFSYMDSEEADRAFSYMEELMDVYGIESSEGRLNTWRYGFDPAAPK